MALLRAFFLRHPALAALLVVGALCMRVLVPSGYMIGQNSKVFTIQLCHDGLDGPAPKQMVIPMKSGSSDMGDRQGKGDCPFSALSMASVSGADAALLVAALAFVLALGFVALEPAPPGRIFHLRPPLRGPPLHS